MHDINSLITASQTAAARGQYHEALRQAKEATTEFPRVADAWILSARLNQQIGQLKDARQDFENACALRPDDPQLIMEFSSLLENLDAYADAQKLLDKAILRLPQDDDLLMTRAGVNARLGDFDAAKALNLQVLERNPDHAVAVFTAVTQGYGDKVGGLDGIRTRLSNSVKGTNEHNSLAYAYARLLEQDKKYDRAFEFYARANHQRAASAGMDIPAKLKGARAVIDDMTGEIINRFSGHGNRSDRPVFIIGMPRSGTTLTEQILAAHPDIYAAGERMFLPLVLRELVTNAPRDGASIIESINNTHADVWNQAGEQYLRCIGDINRQAKRVTDKMPVNFSLLPYIRLIFPGAHIIHLRREPLATIASCIRTRFSNQVLALSVDDWARFYGMYQGLMDHWRPILGQQLLEINYEDLVSDLPVQAKRMIAFLGLEWDEKCLHPERSTNAVNTASIKQVRQGVHTGAINAWRNYETQLEALRPLIAESRAFLAPSGHSPGTG